MGSNGRSEISITYTNYPVMSTHICVYDSNFVVAQFMCFQAAPSIWLKSIGRIAITTTISISQTNSDNNFGTTNTNGDT